MRGGFAVLVLTFGLSAGAAHPQSPQPESDFQSWNDFQITVPIAEKLDLYAAATARLGKNVSRLNDGRAAVGIGWRANKNLTIMPFYWFIRARNANSQFRNEHRLNLRATVRFPLAKFTGVHRSTYEYRIREPLNSWRYRALAGVERDIPKSVLPNAKWFINDEVFYDSGLGRFSRNRFSVGISKTLTKQLTVDVSYMRQNDGVSRPGDLNTLWAAWRIRL